MTNDLDTFVATARGCAAVTKRLTAVLAGRDLSRESAVELLALQSLLAVMEEARRNGVKPLDAVERFVSDLEKA